MFFSALGIYHTFPSNKITKLWVITLQLHLMKAFFSFLLTFISFVIFDLLHALRQRSNVSRWAFRTQNNFTMSRILQGRERGTFENVTFCSLIQQLNRAVKKTICRKSGEHAQKMWKHLNILICRWKLRSYGFLKPNNGNEYTYVFCTSITASSNAAGFSYYLGRLSFKQS